MKNFVFVSWLVSVYCTVFLIPESVHSQNFSYSAYQCHSDWIKKLYEFRDPEALWFKFIDSRPLEWAKRCVGYENRDVNERDKEFGESALHVVSKFEGATEVILYLLKQGADPDAQDNRGLTPIQTAIINLFSFEDRAIENIINLVENGANPNTKDIHRNTALHHAAAKDFTGLMRLLIDNGANVNDRNQDGVTALHLSADRANPLSTKLLLDSNAKTSVQAHSEIHMTGILPWYITRYSGKPEVAITPGGSTPLHLVASYEILALPSIRSAEGEPLLSDWDESLLRRHAETCQMLVDAGAKTHKKDVNGKTAFDLAFALGHNEELDVWERKIRRSNRECASIFKHAEIENEQTGTLKRLFRWFYE